MFFSGGVALGVGEVGSVFHNHEPRSGKVVDKKSTCSVSSVCTLRLFKNSGAWSTFGRRGRKNAHETVGRDHFHKSIAKNGGDRSTFGG